MIFHAVNWECCVLAQRLEWNWNEKNRYYSFASQQLAIWLKGKESHKGNSITKSCPDLAVLSNN